MIYLTDLITLAYDYLDEYRTKDYYQEFIKLSLEMDSKYGTEIKEFNKIKDIYDEVLEIGRFHPDFKEVTVKYRDAKVKLLSIEDIKRYYELDRLIEKELNQTFNLLNEYISPNIPVFNKLGFVSGNKGGNCSGNCG